MGRRKLSPKIPEQSIPVEKVIHPYQNMRLKILIQAGNGLKEIGVRRLHRVFTEAIPVFSWIQIKSGKRFCGMKMKLDCTRTLLENRLTPDIYSWKLPDIL